MMRSILFFLFVAIIQGVQHDMFFSFGGDVPVSRFLDTASSPSVKFFDLRKPTALISDIKIQNNQLYYSYQNESSFGIASTTPESAPSVIWDKFLTGVNFSPRGLFLHPRYIFVADEKNNAVSRLDYDGTEIDGLGSGFILSACGPQYTASGGPFFLAGTPNFLFVGCTDRSSVDLYKGAIEKWDISNDVQPAYHSNLLTFDHDHLAGMALRPPYLYFTTNPTNRLGRIHIESGRIDWILPDVCFTRSDQWRCHFSVKTPNADGVSDIEFDPAGNLLLGYLYSTPLPSAPLFRQFSPEGLLLDQFVFTGADNLTAAVTLRPPKLDPLSDAPNPPFYDPPANSLVHHFLFEKDFRDSLSETDLRFKIVDRQVPIVDKGFSFIQDTETILDTTISDHYTIYLRFSFDNTGWASILNFNSLSDDDGLWQLSASEIGWWEDSSTVCKTLTPNNPENITEVAITRDRVSGVVNIYSNTDVVRHFCAFNDTNERAVVDEHLGWNRLFIFTDDYFFGTYASPGRWYEMRVWNYPLTEAEIFSTIPPPPPTLAPSASPTSTPTSGGLKPPIDPQPTRPPLPPISKVFLSIQVEISRFCGISDWDKDARVEFTADLTSPTRSIRPDDFVIRFNPPPKCNKRGIQQVADGQVHVVNRNEVESASILQDLSVVTKNGDYASLGISGGELIIPPTFAPPNNNPTVAPLAPSPSSGVEGGGGLGTGALVGIIVAGIIAVVIVIIVIAIIVFRLKSQQNEVKNRGVIQTANDSNAPLSGVITNEPKKTNYSAVQIDGDGEPRRKETTYDTMKRKDWFIDESELTYGPVLGSGSFGVVYKGTWRNAAVAIKQNTNVANMDDFLEEARLMLELRPHQNIVQLLGVVIQKDDRTKSKKASIVMEFLTGGSLDTLAYDKTEPLTGARFITIAKGIAAGLSHLHREKIIHRDLACRNVLLNDTGICKISDFGFSRMVENGGGGKTETKLGPIFWMAPECFKQRYSTASDVWSFGIVLWELIAREQPYKDCEDILEVAQSIKSEGKHPKIPSHCHPKIREIMLSCWQVDPDKRPTCDDIFNLLKKIKLDDVEMKGDSDGEFEMESFEGDDSNYLPTGTYTGT